MSVVLFIIGVIAALLGAGMFAYGIPVKEFSFGNTLIIAGTTSAVGGLVIIAIGVAVGHLQRIGETLAMRPPVRSSRPPDMFEAPAGVAPGRIPFPPPPKIETAAHESLLPTDDEPAHAETPFSDHAAAVATPALQNPEASAAVTEEFEVQEHEDFSLSPQQPAAAAPPDFEPPAAPPRAEGPSPAFEPPPRFPPPAERPSQPSYFDAMWPPESKPVRRPATELIKPEPKSVPAQVPVREAQNSESPPAILKSGVVDGMAYTLYVDGSIEAELPTGILHFASINELRDHLAKNS